MQFLLSLAVTNWVGVIVAAIAAMIIGFIWYSPVLFGKQWMKAEHISPNESKKMMKNPWPYVGMFIMAIISAAALSVFFNALHVTTTSKGVEVAIGAWVFVATASFGMTMMSKRPKGMWVIESAHLFIAFIIIGAILVLV
jgi:hypothetical protein